MEHLTKQTFNVNNVEARANLCRISPENPLLVESKVGLSRIMEFQKGNPISKYGYLPCYKLAVQEVTKLSNVRWPKNPERTRRNLVRSWAAVTKSPQLAEPKFPCIRNHAIPLIPCNLKTAILLRSSTNLHWIRPKTVPVISPSSGPSPVQAEPSPPKRDLWLNTVTRF